ncbi:hypothetical protein K440DRAFT_638588 [Wilcoxina mikolae CBS 423.85]|nr:hypothetical protein K440DRAFT_638588 [Wilcoxina mikolae CBS 423.85]
MSANNLTINISKFDRANYNKYFRQVELLLESKHILGIVTGNLKRPLAEALVENRSASERLALVMLMEFYIDMHSTARSTLLLTMEERLQLKYIKSRGRSSAFRENFYEADTAEDDRKGLAVRKCKKATVMPDGEHIFYLLYGIPNIYDWKTFLEFMQDKNVEDTM